MTASCNSTTSSSDDDHKQHHSGLVSKIKAHLPHHHEHADHKPTASQEISEVEASKPQNEHHHHHHGIIGQVKEAWARGDQPANGYLGFGVHVHDGQVDIQKAI